MCRQGMLENSPLWNCWVHGVAILCVRVKFPFLPVATASSVTKEGGRGTEGSSPRCQLEGRSAKTAAMAAAALPSPAAKLPSLAHRNALLHLWLQPELGSLCFLAQGRISWF